MRKENHMEQKKNLNKVLGKADLFAIGFGAIIGWGWISMGSFWIGGAGVLGACFSFVFAGVLMMFVALVYAELASAMPKAGGPQNFAWKAYGPKLSFVAGWACLLNPVVFVSWLCNAMVVALNYLFPLTKTPLLYTIYGYDVYAGTLITYMVLALLMIWLAYTGIQGMSKIQNISIVIMIGLTVIFIVAAFVKGDATNFQPLMASGAKGVVANILTCATFLAGFECIPQASEESTVSPRELGKIIVIVMGAAVAWFVLTIIATSLALSHEEVKNSSLAAVDAMTMLFHKNPLAGKAMILVGLLGIITSWISTYISGSRLMYSMARGGMLPSSLAVLHPKYGTPCKAVLLMGGFMILSGFLGGGVNVWYPSAGGFGSVVSYTIVAISFITLRKKRPDMPRPYKVPRVMIGVLAAIMGIVLIVISLPGVPGSGLKWPYEMIMVSLWIVLGACLFWRIRTRPEGFTQIDRTMNEILSPEKE